MSMAAIRMDIGMLYAPVGGCYRIKKPFKNPTMNRRDRLDAVVHRRLQALVHDLPSARRGSAEALHRARVASRRVREALPLLSALGDKLGKACRRTRQLTRALGSVRELDVAIGLLDRIAPSTSPERLALERVRQHLTFERGRLRKDMNHRLADLRPNRVVRKIAERMEGLGGEDSTSPAWRRALAERLKRRSAALLEAMDRAGELYLPDRLHRVRVAAKKLRYALELAGETGRAPTRGAIRCLRQVQDVLGRLHDCDVLAGHVRQAQTALAPSQQEQSDALDHVLRDLVTECRTLHAHYITRRAAPRRACKQLRERPRSLWFAKTPGASTIADRESRS